MLDPSLRFASYQDHKHRANTMHTLVTQQQLRGLPTTVGPCYYGIALATDMPQRRIDLSASSEQEPSFGARLRQLREAAGLTQEELARRAGLTRNAISALERGERRRPYPHTVRTLADALGLSEEERATLLAVAIRQDGEFPTARVALLEATLPI